MTTTALHKIASQALKNHDVEVCRNACRELLDDNPDDAMALWMLGALHGRADDYGVAYQFFKRALELKPERDEIWWGIGGMLDHMGQPLLAREYIEQAIEISHGLKPDYHASMGLTYLHEADHEACKYWCELALERDPTHEGASVTKSFSHLALGEWATAWPLFARSLGGKFRLHADYGLPEWQGERGAKVVIYGEQGLGDEIMYLSAMREARRVCDAIAYDGDPRLVKWLRGAFDDKVQIYGTRRQREKPWFDRSEWTHQAPLARLFELYRPSPSACHGAAFLVGGLDEELLAMYSALQDYRDEQKIRVGLCWSGGSRLEDRKKRKASLEAFRPLIEAYSESHAFYSLEYNDPRDEIKASGLPVRHHQIAVGAGAYYAHTAAYIGALDIVVGVPTTAIHAAGAIGVSTICLVNDKPTWTFAAMHGEHSPFYKSVRLFRQSPGEAWADTVKRFVEGQPL